MNKLGGYDLFHRLAPRTHAWASLGLVRKVAATVDAGLRKIILNQRRRSGTVALTGTVARFRRVAVGASVLER